MSDVRVKIDVEPLSVLQGHLSWLQVDIGLGSIIFLVVTGWCTQVVHSRSRISGDPHIRSMRGRSTWARGQQRKYCLHRARKVFERLRHGWAASHSEPLVRRTCIYSESVHITVVFFVCALSDCAIGKLWIRLSGNHVALVYTMWLYYSTCTQ